MRSLILIAAGITSAAAQSSTTTFSLSNPQLSVQAIVEPEMASPNSQLTITFTMMPGAKMHVYAPGAVGYQALTVTLDPQPGLKLRKIIYPASENYHFEPLDERMPVYSKPFAVKQVVDVSAAALKGKKTLTLGGQLKYQACDDRVCYKPNAVPFSFTVPVRPGR